jgi:hypothetical protein
MLEKSPRSLRPPRRNHLNGAGGETVKPGSNANERCGGTGGCLQRRRHDRVWGAPTWDTASRFRFNHGIWLPTPPLRLSPPESTSAIDTTPTRASPLSHPLFPCRQPISPYCPTKLLVWWGLWRRSCPGPLPWRSSPPKNDQNLLKRRNLPSEPAHQPTPLSNTVEDGTSGFGADPPMPPWEHIEDEELML